MNRIEHLTRLGERSGLSAKAVEEISNSDEFSALAERCAPSLGIPARFLKGDHEA